ncbi:hypothetical protein T4A_9323 [Trichinella pseudospiralis]|uniref:Uncharacterized protein n=1 Tax=Trichinella pseudospiralis TaxID=6337 RepID=A0A0V1D7T5_TRIPS|nr:hypothetical protein T4A_9323 [Trichinella pseudospiralis]
MFSSSRDIIYNRHFFYSHCVTVKSGLDLTLHALINVA